MSTITFEVDDSVGILALDNGPKNPITSEMVHEITDMLNDVRSSSDIRGLVMASRGERFFSIGLDLPQLIDLERDDFAAFFNSFNRLCIDLYSLPVPTIAAVNGHAIAGGCILALCCDQRYASNGRLLMGLNEVKLGVPLPYPTDRMLHQLVGARNAYEIAASGDFYGPEPLLKMGFVDKIIDPELLMEKAVSRARELGACPGGGLSKIKEYRVRPVVEDIWTELEASEAYFVERWYSDEVRKQLRDAISKF